MEIDFNHVDSAQSITSEYLLSKLTEEQIFFYYFGRFELGKSYPSKLRRDSTPSTGFYINRTGNIIYNDLRTGEKLNCFRFVAKLFHLEYRDALNKIAQDFGLVKGNASAMAKHILEQGVEFDRELKKNTLIQFIPGQWTEARVLYWMQYGITVEHATKANIFPVDALFVNKVTYNRLPELCFAYLVYASKKDKEPKVKIYCPNKEGGMKWLSNVPLALPFGMDTLVYGTDHILITKAKKDMEVLKLLHPSVIGTQNESESAFPDDIVKHICFNFPRRTIIWDADITGVEACKKFNSKGFGYFNTPKSLLEKGIKDVSDYVKAFGLDALKELLQQKGIL